MSPPSFAQHAASIAQAKAIHARKRKARRKRPALKRLPDQQPEAGRLAASYLAVSLTQRRGQGGEERAERYLLSQGLTVLERNLRCKMGEIDLVATDRSTLIFVEVRLRQSSRYGDGAASVNRHKQARLIRAAQLFLPHLVARYFCGKTPPCRFDVVSIDGEQLRWVTHAFDHNS